MKGNLRTLEDATMIDRWGNAKDRELKSRTVLPNCIFRPVNDAIFQEHDMSIYFCRYASTFMPEKVSELIANMLSALPPDDKSSACAPTQ